MYIRIKLSPPSETSEEVSKMRERFGVVKPSTLPRNERRPRKARGVKLGKLLRQALAS